MLPKTGEGKIVEVTGQIVVAEFLNFSPLLWDILFLKTDKAVKMEVVSQISGNAVKCVLFSDPCGVKRGDTVVNTGERLNFYAGENLSGRVVDLFGNPKDGLGPIPKGKGENMPLRNRTPGFYATKSEGGEFLETGIKAIDFFAPMTVGGKIGMFGGAGVGKTVVLTELINNLVVKNRGLKKTRCVYCAVGERLREAQELCFALDEAGVLNNVAVILGQMGENPVIRSYTPNAALALVEYYRDVSKNNVMFFMDNAYRFAQAGQEISGIKGDFPSEEGYQPNLTSSMAEFHERLVSGMLNAVTSVEAVYVPSDDVYDFGVRELFPYMDAFIVLSRDEYQKGRMPALDPLRSASNALKEGIVTKHHLNALNEARRVIKKAETLERVVSLIGPSELSLEDQKIYKRAQHIKNYMTQPFFTVEGQTGRKGTFVPCANTVEDVMGIVEGKWDGEEPEKFLYIGKIS